ncbi:hypothetical protein GOBAR_AA15052 [Gossypium barbadense]|uniref:Endonuclease/exonuclease/phosphatase domain-containing protein n=1 Tax=Gossypium barbadense TaxID=3634 RepID=A0A2P5XQG7_GOSBA|nr:hypothetical protein GOBAR_AA15052 [Gossypium barbadense]
MLRRVKSTVKEGWIVGGGDFNTILNNAEKKGSRRKPRNSVDDFCDILEELLLVDVKTSNGWCTGTKNKKGSDLVNERLDRFLISKDMVEKMPFLTTKVVRQSKFDHEAIIMNTIGSKLGKKYSDPKACFKYDKVHEELGLWQFQRYKRLKNKITGLEKKIGNLMGGLNWEKLIKLLKTARGKLGYLYEVKEKYWTQRAHIQWLREGDRNTFYFHLQATGRKEKNNIEKLKDSQGTWHEDKNEICNIAWSYFNDLFKTTTASDGDVDLHFILEYIIDSMNSNLNREFTDNKILATFKQMDPHKAPRVNGLLERFFKEHWQ